MSFLRLLNPPEDAVDVSGSETTTASGGEASTIQMVGQIPQPKNARVLKILNHNRQL